MKDKPPKPTPEQLSMFDPEPPPPGWSEEDVAWFAAGCPLPVPHNVIPLP